MKKEIIIALMFIIIPSVFAIDSSYNLIVEDNGNSLVVIELSGNGLINIPLQKDVSAVKVKGALYMLKNNSVDISIGSTNKAILAYKTTYLTKKEGDVWQLNFNSLNNKTIVSLPKNTLITKTIPSSFIEPGNFTKIVFDNSNQITIEYRFDDILPDIPSKAKNSNLYFVVIGLVAGSVLAFIAIKKPRRSKKEEFLKTLSINEKTIVKLLMENKGSMKRNELEKQSKIAKSSLANTLNNLEKKKILAVDKTYTTHFVKLEGWFDEL